MLDRDKISGLLQPNQHIHLEREINCEKPDHLMSLLKDTRTNNLLSFKVTEDTGFITSYITSFIGTHTVGPTVHTSIKFSNDGWIGQVILFRLGEAFSH